MITAVSSDVQPSTPVGEDEMESEANPCLHLSDDQAEKFGLTGLAPGQTYSGKVTFKIGGDGEAKMLDLHSMSDVAPISNGSESGEPPQPTAEDVPMQEPSDEEGVLGYAPVAKKKPSFPIDMAKLRR